MLIPHFFQNVLTFADNVLSCQLISPDSTLNLVNKLSVWVPYDLSLQKEFSHKVTYLGSQILKIYPEMVMDKKTLFFLRN